MTEKIEKLFAMTEAEKMLFQKVVANAAFSHFKTDLPFIIEADKILKALPLITGEPCGYGQFDPDGKLCDAHGVRDDHVFTTALYTHAKPLQETNTDRNDALCDAAYLAGCSAGFNTAESDDPEALNKLIASRNGYIKVLKESRENTQPLQPLTADSSAIDFIAYLINNHEQEMIYEERLQKWLADWIKHRGDTQ